MRIFDEFVACGFPLRYCSFKKSVIRLVSFKVVVNGGGGVFVLGNVAFLVVGDVIVFVDFLHVGQKDDCLLEFVAIDCAR